jgi:hypothetical protein
MDQALTRLLFLPIAAFFVQASNAVEALTRVFIDPTIALATGADSFVTALIGGSGTILEAGAESSAEGVGVFGIFAQPIALLVVLASAYLLARYLVADTTSDAIPFTFTDFPLIGADEDEEG